MPTRLQQTQPSAAIDAEGSAEGAGNALTDAAYQAILAELFAGRFRAGEPISEVELARRLSMSRTPVHLAVRELVRDGLLTQAPNRRPVFHPFTSADVQEIYQMRQLLEAEAAALAALRLDRPRLQQLRAACDDLRRRLKARDVLDRWADLDERFHREIAQASGNKRLAQDIFRYRLVHRGFNTIRFTADLVPQALAEHERVLSAFDQRDPAAARTAMVTHLREWEAYYVRSFSPDSVGQTGHAIRRSRCHGGCSWIALAGHGACRVGRRCESSGSSRRLTGLAEGMTM